MVGPHEGNALRLHNAIDLLFRTSQLAVLSHVYKRAALAFDETPGDIQKNVTINSAHAVSKAIGHLFDALEEVDGLMISTLTALYDDERPELVNGGYQVFGGEDAEAAIDRLAALYRAEGHRL